jgi:GntR family transcriptional regulator
LINDPVGHESLPEVTAQRIRSMINDGRLSPGSRLPNELEVAEAMGVSRGTIRAALHLLEQQGLLWRRQGVGTFVSERPILENRLDVNSGVTDLIRSMGLVPGARDIEIKLVPADEYSAQQLGVSVGIPMVHIRRIRTANDKPIVASIDILPLSLLEQSPRPLTLDRLKQLLEEKHSIYTVLKELPVLIDHAVAKIRPIKADALLLKQLHLRLPKDSVMLYIEQVDFDRAQRPVLLSYEYHVADFSTFTVYRH